MSSRKSKKQIAAVPNSSSFWIVKKWVPICTGCFDLRVRVDGALTGSKFSIGDVLVIKPERDAEGFYLAWFENRIEGDNEMVFS